MTLAETTILITGASRGIGRFLASYFAPRCGKIIIMARNDAGLRETAAQVEAAGGRCDCYVADLRDAASLERMAESIGAQGDTVDILINNAANVTSKPLLDTSSDEIVGLIATNVTGTLQLTRLLLPDMVRRGSGSIVNISSLAGYKPNATQTVYSVSKTAVNGISDALWAELKGTGVHVMNVALSSVALAGAPARGQVAVERFALLLERAIMRNQAELFLSPVSKWLMRLYKFCPPLARL